MELTISEFEALTDMIVDAKLKRASLEQKLECTKRELEQERQQNEWKLKYASMAGAMKSTAGWALFQSVLHSMKIAVDQLVVGNPRNMAHDYQEPEKSSKQHKYE